MVRATFRMRSWAHAERPRRVMAFSSSFSPSAQMTQCLRTIFGSISGRWRRSVFRRRSDGVGAPSQRPRGIVRPGNPRTMPAHGVPYISRRELRCEYRGPATGQKFWRHNAQSSAEYSGICVWDRRSIRRGRRATAGRESPDITPARRPFKGVTTRLLETQLKD